MALLLVRVLFHVQGVIGVVFELEGRGLEFGEGEAGFGVGAGVVVEGGVEEGLGSPVQAFGFAFQVLDDGLLFGEEFVEVEELVVEEGELDVQPLRLPLALLHPHPQAVVLAPQLPVLLQRPLQRPLPLPLLPPQLPQHPRQHPLHLLQVVLLAQLLVGGLAAPPALLLSRGPAHYRQFDLIYNNNACTHGNNFNDKGAVVAVRNNYQQQTMGNCSRRCMDCEQASDCSYSMLRLPHSLSSLDKTKLPTLSNSEGEDSAGSQGEEGHLLAAVALSEEGQWQAAINQFMAALSRLPPSHPSFPLLHYHVARCYRELRRLREAFRHCKIAYDKSREGRRRALVGASAELIGEIKVVEQDGVLGAYYYQRALQACCQEQKKIELMYILGVVYSEMGEQEKALSLFLRLETVIQGRQYRIEEEYAYRVYSSLGTIYAARHSLHSAASYLSRALGVVRTTSEEYAQTHQQLQSIELQLHSSRGKPHH